MVLPALARGNGLGRLRASGRACYMPRPLGPTREPEDVTELAP